MITIKNIEDIVTRIGLDMELQLEATDNNGDYICVFDPDTDFSKVRDAIISNPVFFKKVNDGGLTFMEIFDTIWVDGNKTNVAIRFGYCDGHFGTRIKLMVKSVDIQVGNTLKTFLSFDAYHNYIDNLVVGE